MKCAFLLHVVCMSMHCIAFDVHALHSQCLVMLTETPDSEVPGQTEPFPTRDGVSPVRSQEELGTGWVTAARGGSCGVILSAFGPDTRGLQVHRD